MRASNINFPLAENPISFKENYIIYIRDSKVRKLGFKIILSHILELRPNMMIHFAVGNTSIEMRHYIKLIAFKEYQIALCDSLTLISNRKYNIQTVSNNVDSQVVSVQFLIPNLCLHWVNSDKQLRTDRYPVTIFNVTARQST